MLSQRQESELITAIKGRGEIPLKFAYLGKGTLNWDRIAKKRSRASHAINSVEAELLSRRAHDFLNTFRNTKRINVVDIGCGNGEPVRPILDELSRRNIPFRYVAIDISAEMLTLATKNIAHWYAEIETQQHQLDFERGNFSDITYELKKDGSANLLLFLGSTLGNHDDRQAVLTNFRDSMTADDYLVVGVELTNLSTVSKLLPHYKGRIVEEFLYFIPEHIGISRRMTAYEVVWNEREHQIECRMLLKRDVKTTIGTESFLLEKHEQLLLSRSVKFTEWTFTKLFSDAGFRTELLTTTPDRSYVLAMLQPTRYRV